MTIAEKIKALIAKAHGTDNEFEAEAFLDKANELMEKYQIDASHLREDSDPVIRHNGVSFSAKSHSWMWELYRWVAKYYGCEAIRDNNWEWDPKRLEHKLIYTMVVFGRESATITTDLMYEYLRLEVGRHARRIAPETGLSPAAQARRVGAELIFRIQRLIPPKEKARTLEYNKLALVAQNEAIRLRDEAFPPDTLVPTPFNLKKSDYLSREAAQSINLNLQAKGGKGRLRLGGGE